MVEQSIHSLTTKLYDGFQYLTNGILWMISEHFFLFLINFISKGCDFNLLKTQKKIKIILIVALLSEICFEKMIELYIELEKLYFISFLFLLISTMNQLNQLPNNLDGLKSFVTQQDVLRLGARAYYSHSLT